MHWDTQRYLDRHGFIIERGRVLVDLLAPQTGEYILDLGCGTGDIAQVIADRGAEVVGVDASADMVTAARSRFPSLDFRVEDAAMLSFQDEFDAVFSHAMLHWVIRAEDAIRGIHRALKPGGRFITEFGGYRNCAALEAAFAQALRRVTGRAYRSLWYFPSLSDYATRLEANGFIVRAAWYFDLPTPLKGDDGLRQWTLQFLSHHLYGLDDATREAMLADMETTARPVLWRDGVWQADYRRLRVVAIKSVFASLPGEKDGWSQNSGLSDQCNRRRLGTSRSDGL
jgi:trans-aconitate methyltransferase